MEEKNTKQDTSKASKDIPIYIIFILIILLIWWIAGMIGFIMSIVCCFYNSSTSDKFLGIIVAWIMGPFYWLYFIYNSSYCNRFSHEQIPQQTYY